jgi:hypothetical protein
MALTEPLSVTASSRRLPVERLAPVPVRRKVVGDENVKEMDPEF